MANNLRSAPPPAPVALPTVPSTRDPEAERSQLDDFMAGLARGNDAPSEMTDSPSSTSPPGDA
jgi:hypothetical protein